MTIWRLTSKKGPRLTVVRVPPFPMCHSFIANYCRPWEFRLPEYMVHDEHRPFGDDYDYKNDPEGRVYWKKGRVAPGEFMVLKTTSFSTRYESTL